MQGEMMLGGGPNGLWNDWNVGDNCTITGGNCIIAGFICEQQVAQAPILPDGILMNGKGVVQVYDPTTPPNQFCSVQLPMPHRLGGSAITSPTTGLIYITDAEVINGGVYIYDPNSGSLTKGPRFRQNRFYAAMTDWMGTRIIVCGGEVQGVGALNTCEYIVEGQMAAQWTPLGANLTQPLEKLVRNR